MPARTEENLSAPAPHEASADERKQHFSWRRAKAAWIAVACLIALLVTAGTLLALHWPFTQIALALALEQDSQAKVEIGSYQETYFPHPGAVAENVVFERDAQSPRLTVHRLTIVGSYFGMLHRYIPRVVAEGAVLSVPAGALNELFASPAPGQHPTNTSVGEIDADGTQILVATEDHDGPLTFDFHELKLRGVSKDSAIRFVASVQIPEPTGDAQLQGQIGPFRRNAAGSTPLSGSYSFKNAKLEQFTGVGGVLSSEGKLEGNLQAISVDGTTDTPDFQLDVGVHPVPLTTKFHALVNGTNGDLRLDPVEASFGKTTVIARGDIQGPNEAKNSKTTALDMTCSSGRVQDVLQLFVHDNQPPMSGAVTFHAHVVLPSEIDHFLRKVKLEGEFGIEGAQFTSHETQQEVDILSADARGQADKIEDDQAKDRKNGNHATVNRDLQPIVSNFKGKVTLSNGIANFSALSFDTPGATALLTGTYGLESRQIDMHGTAHLDTTLSGATTGVKSFLLKVVGSLKPNHGKKGSTVGVHVTGTYGHPSYAVEPMKGG
jgi:AsmA-like C-terminal region